MTIKPGSVRIGRIIVGLIVTLLLAAVALYLGKGYLDLRYVSSQVGSSVDWNAAHEAFEGSFSEGMLRAQVHAKLLELDPSLRDQLPTALECLNLGSEPRCIEQILVFRRAGYRFNYDFYYTPDQELIKLSISS
jgi:hypothetical protein